MAILYVPLDDFRVEAGCVDELVAIVVDGSDSRRVAISIENCFNLGCGVGVQRKAAFAGSEDDVKRASNLRRRLFLKSFGNISSTRLRQVMVYSLSALCSIESI